MNNNLRMSGAMCLMLKKSGDRRQREALEAAFKKADVNGDGLLSLEEYYRILKAHGIDCSHEEIKHIMQIADKDHDGFISKEEFLGDSPNKERRKSAAASSSATSNPSSRTERAFSVFDKNNDGFVSKQEMLNMSSKFTPAQVDAVFARNDVNHDGKLTLKEFEEFMERKPKEPKD